MDAKRIEELEYTHPKLLATGQWAGLMRFIFTTGLVVGIDEVGYRTRFCYHNTREALTALEAWDGHGDPPGHWIKEKGWEGDRPNPRAAEFKGIPIRT